MIEVRVTIDDDVFVEVSLLEAGVCFLNALHEESSVEFLSFVDEIVAYYVFKELE